MEDEDGALVLFRGFLKEAGAQHPRAVRKAAAEVSDYVEDKLISMRHEDIRMRSAGLDKNALVLVLHKLESEQKPNAHNFLTTRTSLDKHERER